MTLPQPLGAIVTFASGNLWPAVVLVILAVVIAPAIWSRRPDRQRAAMAVIMVVLDVVMAIIVATRRSRDTWQNSLIDLLAPGEQLPFPAIWSEWIRRADPQEPSHHNRVQGVAAAGRIDPANTDHCWPALRRLHELNLADGPGPPSVRSTPARRDKAAAPRESAPSRQVNVIFQDREHSSQHAGPGAILRIDRRYYRCMRSDPPPFLPILRSSTQAGVLTLLLLNPELEVTQSELADGWAPRSAV